MFQSLPERLRGDELIVVNNARVIPARLLGRRLGVRAESCMGATVESPANFCPPKLKFC